MPFLFYLFFFFFLAPNLSSSDGENPLAPLRDSGEKNLSVDCRGPN